MVNVVRLPLTQEKLKEYTKEYNKLNDLLNSWNCDEVFTFEELLNNKEYCEIKGKYELLHHILDINDYFIDAGCI